ncbi:PcfJ domain-containing protein [Desulfovibrio sp. OttesenSCG-928-G15]|nr:PcfJ domain-containing protein [Desulfovibrio sp. OttesenSCG-928-G15]
MATDLLTAGEENHPIARYAYTVPAPVRAPLAECNQGQLAVLQVCAASQRGIQLLHSSPLLLWYVSPYLLLHAQGEPERIHQLLGLKQNDLLNMACGRRDKSLLKLLDRIPLPVGVSAPHTLLTSLLTSEPAGALLRHKKALGWDYLDLLHHSVLMLHLPLPRSILLSEMPTNAMRSALAESRRIVEDTRRMGAQLGIADTNAIIGDCRDWKQIVHVHDSWAKRLATAKLDDLVASLGNDLPSPPLPGTDTIFPIDTVRELLIEGKVMHHCVGGYVSSVRAGECYIYRMIEPERVTIELRQTAKGRWRAAQVTSYCNRKPALSTLRALDNWLLEANGNLR